MGKKIQPVLFLYIRHAFLGFMICPIFLAVVASGHGKNGPRNGLAVFPACEAAESGELFTVDVVQQKTNLEKEFAKIKNWIPPAKLHEVRGTLDLIEHKVDRLRKNLSREDIVSYQSRIDTIRKIITIKEDSLVNLTIKIMRTQGVDASLQFMQNDLRAHGVGETKISDVERKILEEAPAIKQAQERDAIARTIAMLENGKVPDSSIDPYIVKTAERIMKARQDSVRRIEDEKKRKAMEEHEKIERARIEKEMKEKQKQDELLAKQKQEEEKQRLIEEQRQKKLLAQQERARKDSLAEEAKINKRKEELDRESERRIAAAIKERKKAEYNHRKPLIAQQEKRLKDSLEADQKQKERLSMTEEQLPKQAPPQQGDVKKDSLQTDQKEKAPSAMIDEQHQRQIIMQQWEARKDSIEADRNEKERLARVMEQPQKQIPAPQVVARKDSLEADRKEKDRLIRVEEQRQKQILAQREGARKDSIEANRKDKDRLTRIEDQRQKQILAQREDVWDDNSLEADRKEKERLARIEDQRQKQILTQRENVRIDSVKQHQELLVSGKRDVKIESVQKNQKTGPEVVIQAPKQVPSSPAPIIASVKQNPASPLPEAKQQQQAGSKYAQEYLQKLSDNQKESQKCVMDLYKMLGQGMGKEALEKYRQRRDFISQYLDPEVFNVLEQSIMQSVIESPASAGNARDSNAVQPNEGKKVSPDQERIDRINGLIRDNKIEAAYTEFKKSEKQLKNAMPKDDFKQLKSMVENSYKTFKSNNK